MEYIDKLKTIKEVELPDFLFENIVNAIEQDRIVTKKNSLLITLLTVVLILVNVAITNSYRNITNNTETDQEINPYSYSENLYYNYE